MEKMSLKCATPEMINSVEYLDKRFQQAARKNRELEDNSVDIVYFEEQKQK